MDDYRNGHVVPTDAPAPDRPHYVARDGVRVSPYLRTENDAFAWILRHQGMSVDWAMRYEGYAIRNNGDA